ncbi:MAG: hypothetical protein K0U45_00665 [Alphaproteobacteria bacterium]|nr:hypothetical protein [Alphaproteobacteria bacterium]
MTYLSLTGKSKAKYLDLNKRRPSIIIKRHRKNGRKIFDYIRIGSTFNRTRGDKAVEYVHITGLSTDSFGIPHIRYDAHSRATFATSKNYDGSKMLSLPAFINMFHHKGHINQNQKNNS